MALRAWVDGFDDEVPIQVNGSGGDEWPRWRGFHNRDQTGKE